MTNEPRNCPDESIVSRLIDLAARSGCKKSKRGVLIISRSGQAVAVGTNQPVGSLCDGSEACRRDCAKICVHAEQMALLGAGYHAWGGELYHLKCVEGPRPLPDLCAPFHGVPSGPPSCAECSKLIKIAGVSGVWLLTVEGWKRWDASLFHEETLKNLELHR